MPYNEEKVAENFIKKLEAMNNIAIELNVSIYTEGGGSFKAKNTIALDSLANNTNKISEATRYKLLYFSNRVLTNCQWINKSLNDVYGGSGGLGREVGPPPEPEDPGK